jgi:hypothetical protein
MPHIVEAPQANAVTAAPTAIPLFIGYTERATGAGGESVAGVPVRVEDAAACTKIFGGAPRPLFRAELVRGAYAVTPVPTTRYYLDAALRLFYDNGGGEAYVLSIGTYGKVKARAAADAHANPNVKLADFRTALAALRELPDAALIVIPDAVLLPAADFAALSGETLALCAELDRCFAILDIRAGALPVGAPASALLAVVAEFQQSLPLEHASYGAAYAPWLVSTLFDAEDLTFENLEGGGTALPALLPDAGYEDELQILAEIAADRAPSPAEAMRLHQALLAASNSYQLLTNALAQQASLVPPSGAIAGVYAAVDASRGVWAAPANVALNGIDKPAQRLSDFDQPEMNTPKSGASVGAIRWFPHEGVLVWGARTLAGRDDYRYVNTRRTAIMVAESIRRALPAWVSSPNNAQTWAAILASVNTFLTFLWSRGALAGATASSAFQTQLGAGTTMTEDDVAKGILRLQVSLALTHPAEFTVLELAQQLATP